MKQIRRNDVSKNDIVNNFVKKKKKLKNINKTHMVKNWHTISLKLKYIYKIRYTIKIKNEG